MRTYHLLQVLEKQIEVFSREVELRDKTLIPAARVDTALLSNHHKTQLSANLVEVQKKFTQLHSAVCGNRANQVAYLAEILVAQISVLKRELSDQDSWITDKQKGNKTINLYNKLTKYQNYERQLRLMIKHRQNLLKKQGILAVQQKIQHELAVLAKRLMHCRKTLWRIRHNL